MSILAAIDLAAAARAEYDRRRAGWIQMRDQAATPTDRGRIVTQANGDLMIWQDVVIFFEYRATPADSRVMTRSARTTFDRARESGRVEQAKLLDLYAIWRALHDHAFHRHGYSWPEERATAQPERKAA